MVGKEPLLASDRELLAARRANRLRDRAEEDGDSKSEHRLQIAMSNLANELHQQTLPGSVTELSPKLRALGEDQPLVTNEHLHEFFGEEGFIARNSVSMLFHALSRE